MSQDGIKRDSGGRFIKGTAKCKGGMEKGGKHTPEAVAKIRAANKGKPKSADPNVALYITEPMTLPYTFKGKQRRYIPDLYVEFADGSWAIVEIKPEYQLSWPSVQAKLNAAENELPAGCFQVWDETVLEASSSISA